MIALYAAGIVAAGGVFVLTVLGLAGRRARARWILRRRQQLVDLLEANDVALYRAIRR